MRLNISDELLDEIANRAVKLIQSRGETSQESSGEADGWLRGAAKIAAYLDCPRSRVYALASAHRIPIHHDGSALIARRSELDAWLQSGGGRRP